MYFEGRQKSFSPSVPIFLRKNPQKYKHSQLCKFMIYFFRSIVIFYVLILPLKWFYATHLNYLEGNLLTNSICILNSILCQKFRETGCGGLFFLSPYPDLTALAMTDVLWQFMGAKKEIFL